MIHPRNGCIVEGFVLGISDRADDIERVEKWNQRIPPPQSSLLWLPIAHADKTITEVQDFSEVGITLRTSDRYWVRDEDGRVFEACWSEGDDHSYWWDFEGESPVDPVEYMPHPLADPVNQLFAAERPPAERAVGISAPSSTSGGGE